MDPMDYGYVATGAGAVWQTTSVAIRPRADRSGHRQGRCVDPARIGTRRRGRDDDAATGRRAGGRRSRGAVTRIDPTTNPVVATIPIGPTGSDGPLTMTAGPVVSGWTSPTSNPSCGSIPRPTLSGWWCHWTAGWRVMAWRSGSPSTRGSTGRRRPSASIRSRARHHRGRPR